MNFKKLFTGSGAITGYIIGIVGLFITIWSLNGETIIKNRILVLGGIIILFFLIYMVLIVMNALKIIYLDSNQPVYSCESNAEKYLLYAQYSDKINLRSIVSIYMKTENINKRMGIGYISNKYKSPKEPGYLAIEVIYIQPQYNNEFNDVKNNNKQILDRMYIAPAFFIDDLQELMKGDL